MNTILIWLMKHLPAKSVVDAIFSFLKWLTEQTPTPIDNNILAKLEEIKELLYKLIQSKKK